MIRPAALMIVGALCVAACGETESSVDSIPGAGADASGGATIPTAEPSATTAGGDEECGPDRRTFETAMEAHYAQFGAFPTVESELVDAGFLRAEFDTYDLVDGEVVRVAGVPCPPNDPGPATDEAMTLPTTSDGWFDLFTPEQIAGVGGPDCANELAIIAAGAQLFEGREGRAPDTLDEMRDDLELPVTLWMWSDDDLVPTEGSGCIDANQLDARACRVEARTLQVAREAYLAQFGPATEPTEDDLVAAEFIRQVSDSVDLIDGEVTATPGGGCEGVDLDPGATSGESADACVTDYRTLQVAVEAFVIQEGHEPDNEGQMIDAGILGDRFDTYDIVYGEIVPGDGSRCEAPPN